MVSLLVTLRLIKSKATSQLRTTAFGLQVSFPIKWTLKVKIMYSSKPQQLRSTEAS